jgi:hypothetical protein
MAIPFAATRAYVYHAARYELLPRIVEMVSSRGDEPFQLLEIVYPLLEETYTPEQLAIQIKKKESDKTNSLRQVFAFYIPFLAKKLKVFEYLGGGKFRNISNDEETRKTRNWRKRIPSRPMSNRATRASSTPIPSLP